MQLNTSFQAKHTGDKNDVDGYFYFKAPAANSDMLLKFQQELNI